jgi:hypothetical protein
MHFSIRRSALAISISLSIGVASTTAVLANDGDGDRDDAVAFVQTNLDSNVASVTNTPDVNLTNAWGLAFAPGGAFWVSANHSGTSNLFRGDGSIVPLVVTIPAPKNSPAGSVSAPTGIVSNPTTSFLIPGSTFAAAFIFATNFRAGTIDVFDSNFAPATTDGKFIDQHIRPGFAPFGIQNIDGDLWVTYAKQDADKMDDVAGPGNAFVDVFDTDGHLLRRFAERGVLNSPWGLARAPYGFGQFSGAILIGNQQDGRINAFDSHGNFVGSLRRPNGAVIKIDKLWALEFGGGALSSPESLFFTAGPNDENNGLFGVINAVARDWERGSP